MANSQAIAMDNITRQPQPQGKVFIQRDYSEGCGVKFSTKLPQELADRIDETRFEFTISKLNEFYAEAERLGARTYCESCFACLTAYTVLMCMTTHYDKCVKKAGLFIQQQNDDIYAPRGLVITDPFTRGLRVVEITVYPTGT
ncbi:golgin subfamily A member 7-like [Diadema setosum]|uniref:golgin subfamily A member 7-like n=1 Tax=Diadema antillarum TaxID=105358 RepID=UPI003A85ADA7